MNDAGRIGFVIRGDYSSTATYDFLDLVYFNGATYVAKKLTVGNTPDNTEFWHIFADGNIDVNDIAPTFLQAETRENINSGEKLPVLFGKIKKFFADLKTVAFTGSYADLSNKPTASDIGAVATSKVLDTAELISANTASGNVAGALAVKAIQTSLSNNKYVKLWSGNAGSNETVTFTTDISKLNWRKLLISFYYSANNNTVYCEIPIIYTSIQRNIYINSHMGTIHTIPGEVSSGRISFDWSNSNYRLAEIYAELN